MPYKKPNSQPLVTTDRELHTIFMLGAVVGVAIGELVGRFVWASIFSSVVMAIFMPVFAGMHIVAAVYLARRLRNR